LIPVAVTGDERICMTGPFFVDTNILVYAEDHHDRRKQQIARSLIKSAFLSRTAFLSTQVLSEFFAVSTRKLGLPAASARRRIEIYSALNVFQIGVGDLLAAIDLHRLYQLSIWDGLILRAAGASGCRTLYSEDLQHGQRFDAVKVVNPFLEAPG
jgi:predicted nucleic acid-binding protein